MERFRAHSVKPAALRLLFSGTILLALLVMGAQAKPLPASTAVEAAYIEGEKLEDVLPDLGEKGGISIAAGENCRDRRFFLITQKRTLGRVMAALRRFVPEPGCQAFWFRSGSGTIFDEDLASVRKRRKRAEAHLAEIRRESTDRIAAMRKHAADRSEPHGAGSRKVAAAMLAVFDSLPPHLQKAALELKGGSISISQLTPGAREAVFNYTSLTPQEKARGRLALIPFGSRESPRMRMAAGPLKGSGAYMALGDLYSPIKKDLSGPGEAPPRSPAKERGPSLLPPQPGLRRKAMVGGDDMQTLGVVLRALSDAAGLPLIGEYDPGIPNTQHRRLQLFQMNSWGESAFYLRLREDGPVHELLDKVCEIYDLTWDCRDNWIEIRNPRAIGETAGLFDLSPPTVLGPRPPAAVAPPIPQDASPPSG